MIEPSKATRLPMSPTVRSDGRVLPIPALPAATLRDAGEYLLRTDT